MVSSRRETARRIAIAYVIVGSIFFLFYQFILNPSYRNNPIVDILFFIFLPAILAAVALAYDLVLEGFIRIPKRFQREDENNNEDAWS